MGQFSYKVTHDISMFRNSHNFKLAKQTSFFSCGLPAQPSRLARPIDPSINVWLSVPRKPFSSNLTSQVTNWVRNPLPFSSNLTSQDQMPVCKILTATACPLGLESDEPGLSTQKAL